MIYPSIDKILNKVDSKYQLVHMVAKRARQMSEQGYFQLKEYKSTKLIGKALEEIDQDLVHIRKY